MAVVDGSTSKAHHSHFPFHSNGWRATQLVCDYVRKADPSLSCTAFCQGVTEWVRRHYGWPLLRLFTERGKQQYYLDHPEERLTCSAVVFSRKRREVWLIGDCHCLIGGQYVDNPKPSEAQLAQGRAYVINKLSPHQLLTMVQDGRDLGREAIIGHIVEAMKGQNRDYAVIDGFPIPQRHVIVVPLSFNPCEIVFATDGYPRLFPTLAETEEWLQTQLKKDPLCAGGGEIMATKGRMPGTSSFDDRTYIRFEV